MTDKNQTSSATRIIDAAAKDIFDILSNPARHPETDSSGMVESVDQGERLKEIGDTFTMNMKNANGEYQTKNEVFAIQEDRIIGWKTLGNITSDVPTGPKWLYELEPVDADHTTVKLTYQRDEIESDKILGLSEKFNDELMEKSLDALAAAVAGAE
jgi:hypothetical protein